MIRRAMPPYRMWCGRERAGGSILRRGGRRLELGVRISPAGPGMMSDAIARITGDWY